VKFLNDFTDLVKSDARYTTMVLTTAMETCFASGASPKVCCGPRGAHGQTSGGNGYVASRVSPHCRDR
jgi:hypothetical protein